MGEWPRPRHPGDTIRMGNGDMDVVLGTVLGRHARNGRRDLIDQIVLHDLGNTPVEIVSDFAVVEAAPAPVVNAYRTSQELAAAFDHMLGSLGGGLGAQLVSDARELGYTLYVVGGPVRDLVLGNRTVNDLDMTGDMPAGLFRDLIYYSAMKLLPTERRDLRNAWLPRANISSSGVVHCYRIVPATGEQQKSGIQFTTEKFIEYAAFKDHQIEPGRDEFVYGWDPTVDFLWRDVTINSLLYDPHPQRRVVIDPAGALDDFGVTQRHLGTWTGERVDQSRITLRPCDIPATASTSWAAKAVGRAVKSAHKYPEASLSATTTWIAENEAALQAAATNGDIQMASGFGQHIAKALSPLTGDELFLAVRPIVVRLKQSGAPDWFVNAIASQIPASGAFRGQDEGSAPAPLASWPVTAVGAVLLTPTGEGGTAYGIGDDLPNPADGDPVIAPAYFAEQMRGWREERVEVEGIGQVWVFTDGTRLVAGVDGQGAIVSATTPDGDG